MTTETLASSLVPPASPGEFRPLALGTMSIWPPVALAPMAGVTNQPFRSLCRRLGAPLCISEMINVRPLVYGTEKTWHLASFGPEESPRSLQLYGVAPEYVGEAVKRLVDQGQIDHLDMNFGCPVRKVTRQGGGAALPHKPRLLASIIHAAVHAAGGVPVTIKFRLGIDGEHLCYRETGHIAEAEGCAAVTLHARTAAQLYDGQAEWPHIGELKSALHIPVLGNGDIWEAADALRMMRETGADGVVVGRGCLGRPWLFDDLHRMFSGERPLPPPNLGKVSELMLEHARALVAFMGERPAMRAFRKHSTWYTKGFRGSAELRQHLMEVITFEDLLAALEPLDRTQPFPATALRVPRCKTSGTQIVSLPQGFWDNPEDLTPPTEIDCGDGG